MTEHPLLALPLGDEFFDWRELVVADTEANGLLHKWYGGGDFKFHCAWYYDVAKDEYFGFRPDEMSHFAERTHGRTVAMHNGKGFDFKAMRKVFPEWKAKLEVDTLPLVKMLWHADDLIEGDMKRFHKGQMPGEQIKRQGIEAWGYRLREMKGNYQHDMKARYLAMGGDPKDSDALMSYVWAEFNEPMYDYNKQDVVVNWKLLLACVKKLGWFQKPTMVTGLDGSLIEQPFTGFRTPALAVATEQQMQDICLEMEDEGAGFDQQAGIELAADLERQREALEGTVKSAFKDWFQPKGDTVKGTIAPRTIRRKRTDLPDVTLPRFSEKTGKRLADYVGPPIETIEEGNAYVPITFTRFSLKNRHHLANRLVEVYGWKPKAYGGAKGTDPVIDEATLKDIPDAVLAPDLKQAILDFYVINKTWDTLAGGNKAWLKLYDEETGTIHGRVDPLGTVTHRAAHSNPNLGNIPSVEVDEIKGADGEVEKKVAIVGVAGGFGHECRALFVPRRPFDTQVGIDQYALELQMLGHYLYPYDGGAFAKRLNTPGVDFHAENAKLIGQPRKPGKTTMYMTLFGSGPEGIGDAIWDSQGPGTDDVDDWCDAPGVGNWINWMKREQGDMFKMPSRKRRAHYGKGAHAKKGLLNGIVGLKDLIDDLKASVEKKGYVKLIDGRRVGVRKAFASLNALLQGGGSVACKVWIIQHRARLEAMGLHALVHWALQEWVHDETQWGTMREHAEAVGEAGKWAATETSNILKLRVELQASPMIGLNWADCH